MESSTDLECSWKGGDKVINSRQGVSGEVKLYLIERRVKWEREILDSF
jgi:hypothetical protein